MKISASDGYATAIQGLQRASAQANSAAHKLASGEVEARPIVELSTAEAAFKANAAVIRTLGELDDSLIDILA